MKRPDTVPPWDKKRVGQRIATLRAAKGWQQNTLAEIIGSPATPQKINNYENGRDLIPVHIAGRLCAVTGANFDYVYHGLMGSLPGDLAEAIAKVEKDAGKTAFRRA